MPVLEVVEGIPVEDRAGAELHQGRQRKLKPPVHQEVQPAHVCGVPEVADHRDQQRERRKRREQEAVAPAPDFALPSRGNGVRVFGRQRTRVVSELAHRLQEFRAAGRAHRRVHRRGRRDEIDCRSQDAWHGPQTPFDPPDAAGAGHAADGELEPLTGNAVAEMFDSLHEPRRGDRAGMVADAGLFGS